MAAKTSTSLTYYVGVVNICLAGIWGALYGSGVLGPDSIMSPTATPFYVGTLFAVGFGLIFPSFEKTIPGKERINSGLVMSLISLFVYAGFVAIYFTRSSLTFYDVTRHF